MGDPAEPMAKGSYPEGSRYLGDLNRPQVTLLNISLRVA